MNDKRKNLVVALSILLVGLLVSWLVIIAKPDPAPEPHHEPLLHAAEVIDVQPVSRKIAVISQGTVTPKTEVDVTAQVSGQVTAVAKGFAAGGYFEAAEPLLIIDPRDYQTALTRAEATLADARKAFAQEQGLAYQAQREWRDLGNQAANDLFLRKPQLSAAEASVKAAAADVEQARLNLARTRISLPFAGRVMTTQANLGQFVALGSSVARVYAADVMEIRLPLSAEEIRLLNISVKGDGQGIEPLPVRLRFRAGSELLEWQGELVRVESAVDVQSRLFYVVAEQRVDPKTRQGGHPPLYPGLFVEALIHSNPYRDVVVLPPAALLRRDQVMVLDSENRLQLASVEVLQMDDSELIVRGLSVGQRVLAKPPAFTELGAVYLPQPYLAETASL